MAVQAYVCGWYVAADPDLGRVVTNDVLETLKAHPHTAATLVWPDADGATGEPGKGAVLVVVDAPDATHTELGKLPNSKVFPVNPKAQDKAAIEQFLAARGVTVDLASSINRRETAGRVARALNAAFVDFPTAGL